VREADSREWTGAILAMDRYGDGARKHDELLKALGIEDGLPLATARRR